MRFIFFPSLDVNIPKDSIWSPYTCNGAYIDLYHGYLGHWSKDDVHELDEQLDIIFSNLQCLPASKAPDARGTVIWCSTGGKIQLITNSAFNPIQEVGGRDHVRQAGLRRPQTTSRQLEARIQSTHGAGVGGVESRRRARTKSLKTRN